MNEFVNGVVVVSLLLMWWYLKGLPKRLHDEGLASFQHALDRKLELLKIAQGELQVRKSEKFVELSSFFAEGIIDTAKIQEVLKKERKNANDTKYIESYQKQLLDLSVTLFFFASDQTIRAYAKWRESGRQSSEGSPVSAQDVASLYGNLMVLIRRDLGYTDTTLSPDDFMSVIR